MTHPISDNERHYDAALEPMRPDMSLTVLFKQMGCGQICFADDELGPQLLPEDVDHSVRFLAAHGFNKLEPLDESSRQGLKLFPPKYTDRDGAQFTFLWVAVEAGTIKVYTKITAKCGNDEDWYAVKELRKVIDFHDSLPASEWANLWKRWLSRQAGRAMETVRGFVQR